MISDEIVNAHDKMLMGGIWAIIDIEYDSFMKDGSRGTPFVIQDIKPIQLSTFDNSRYVEKRKEFTKKEWLNVLLRSCGYEPESEGMTERVKMLLLSRLIPMVESNFNFIELGLALLVNLMFTKTDSILYFNFRWSGTVASYLYMEYRKSRSVTMGCYLF